jgi:hypothetical protein
MIDWAGKDLISVDDRSSNSQPRTGNGAMYSFQSSGFNAAGSASMPSVSPPRRSTRIFASRTMSGQFAKASKSPALAPGPSGVRRGEMNSDARQS